MNESFKFISLHVDKEEVVVNIEQILTVEILNEKEGVITLSNGSKIYPDESYLEITSCFSTIGPSEIS